MTKLIILRGLQASGKSTFAKDWVSKDPKHRTRWNRDTLREMSQASYNPKLEAVMHDLMEPYVIGAVLEGYDIIFDDMNISGSALYMIRDIIETLYKEYDTEIEVYKKDFFKVKLETCMERDAKRPKPVSEEVILRTYQKNIGVFTGKQDPWNSILGTYTLEDKDGNKKEFKSKNL